VPVTWGPHLKQKKKQTANLKLHKLRPLLKSKLSLKIKLLIFKTIIRPTWSYGIQIWGPAKPFNIRPIQAHQNITLRLITGAPWYIQVSNASLYKDLNITTVKKLATTHHKRFHFKLDSHKNHLIKNMSSNALAENPKRRLKINWSRNLL
jgi:hypothetical protein